MTSRNTLALMLMGLAVFLFTAASNISAAGTGTGSTGSGATGGGITDSAGGATGMDTGTGSDQGVAGTSPGTVDQDADTGVAGTPDQDAGTRDRDSKQDRNLDQDMTGTQGRIHNVIFGWFEGDDKDEQTDADQDIPTVDQDRPTEGPATEQGTTMDRSGVDRDLTRDADPGASHPGSSPDTMNMDRGATDINRDRERDTDMGIMGGADTDIPADRQPGATTDNLMQRVAFDSQSPEQDQDVDQDSQREQDRDQSVIDQDQSVLDQDQDSPATSPDTTMTPGGSHAGAGPADRDSMGISR